MAGGGGGGGIESAACSQCADLTTGTLLTGASFHRLDLLLATMELRVVSCIPFPRKLHVQNDTQGFVCNENKSHEVQRTGKSLLVFSLCVLRED